MADQRADAGIKQKRETQLERVDKAIRDALGFVETTAATSILIGAAAKAAIAAYPDPHIKKERGRPKSPTDDCVLCALRREFVALVEFIEASAAHMEHRAGCEGPLALCRALREQGVV